MELNKVSFVVQGEPVGKGRPKFTRQGRTYTPAKTVSYENLVKLEYERQCGMVMFEQKEPLKISINAVFSIPKSKSKKEREKMIAGAIRPTKKPDMDNIAKIICDALNVLAYYDDSQIVELEIEKVYGEIPKVEISIERMNLEC